MLTKAKEHLGVSIGRINNVDFYSETEYEDEFEMFLRGGETVLSGKPPKMDGFTPQQV